MKHLYVLAFVLFNVTFSQINLDTSFNGAGLFNDNTPESQGPFVIKDFVELPSKAVILVGEKRLTNSIFGQNDLMVVKLKADGTVDTSFATNGVYRLNYQNDYDYASSVALQADGKILVGGGISSGGAFHGGLIRLNPNGSLDPSFGSGGIKLYHLSSAQDHINDILVTTSGIYLGYQKGVNGSVIQQSVILKVLVNGDLDTSFGTNGVLEFSYASGAVHESLKIAKDASNRLIALYHESISGVGKLKVWRVSMTGAIDTSFGVNGVFEHAQTNDNCNIQVKGNELFLTGQHSSPGVKLMKVRENGQLDATFGVSGVVNVNPNHSFAKDLIVHDDGKITVAGSRVGNKATLYRFNANGTIDTSFGTNGVLSFDHAGIKVFKYNSDKSKYLGVSYTLEGLMFKPLSWIGRYTDTTLSIQEQDYVVGVAVYPNPMKEVLNIQSNTIVQRIVLHDALGKKVMEVSNSNSLNTSGLSKGVYMLAITFKNGQQLVKKVVK